MKQISRLYRNLRKESFHEKYPDYNLKDGKVHVLFIGTYLNATGYYRHIIPAFELNQTDTHVSILTSLQKWDYNKLFGEGDENHVDNRLVIWADYIVVPPIFSDASYFFNVLREQNSRLQIVLDIDQNIHSIPQEHPAFSSISTEFKHNLLRNMAVVDIVNFATQGLFYFYERLLSKHYLESIVYLNHQQNILSALAYENAKALTQRSGDRARIGLVGSANSSFNFEFLIPILKSLKDKHSDKIELILFGWNGEVAQADVLDGLEVSIVKSVRFTEYFDQLNALGLDMALLPVIDLHYNTHGRSAIQYLELSASGIPVVASDLPPYNLSITDEETGLLAESEDEWLNQINRLIEQPKLRTTLAENALKSVWYNHACNWESLEELVRLYR